MSMRFFWLSVLAVVVSFAGGFLLSNSLNRKEISSLKAENARMTQSGIGNSRSSATPELSKEEIRKKIVDAEENQNNFTFQKELGLALYRYAIMKRDQELVSEVVKLLERANKLNPKDYEVLVSLGNAHFDIGRQKEDDASLKKAREFYQDALDINPHDVAVRTDLGLTFAVAAPAEYRIAIDEYKKALKTDPKNEKGLQLIIKALLKLKHKEEAAKYLITLRNIHSQNTLITDFAKQIAQENNK